MVDPTDRTTCVLFGDGAGAAVFELAENAPFAVTLGARGNEAICAGGPAACDTAPITMDGRAVFRFAVEAMPRCLQAVLDRSQKTLSDLDLDYLDLYLIHWPASKKDYENWEEINLETWRAMTDLYKAGKIKAIGVSNFKPHHLEALMKTEVKPMVNQIEFHPGFMQEETVKYCRENGILVEAWSPLGTGRMLTNPDLQEIASHYGKSVAQICIRWCIQHDVLPLPKSVTPSRIEENSNVFDFEINAEDMQRIDALENFGGSGLDPDEVDF